MSQLDSRHRDLRLEYNTRCPRCWYNETGPMANDYEWVCRGCLTIFDVRDREPLGRVYP